MAMNITPTNFDNITTEFRDCGDGVTVRIVTDSRHEDKTVTVEAFNDALPGFGIEGDNITLQQDGDSEQDFLDRIERAIEEVVDVIQTWLDYQAGDEDEPDGF